MEKIKAAQLPTTDLLSKEEIEELLPELDILISWAKGVQDYALQQALKGEKFAGWKVVEGRTVKKLTDPDQAVKLCVANGIPEALLFKPRELVSVTDMEKILGRPRFAQLIAPLVDKGVGKPALVVESDKRPEFKLTRAEDDFKEVLE